ncbi:MAG: winged helix-turn-helix domain-containing protein [Alphaproteobacteria bacterium]|nr:winged helix-turn-helix domain-containing protein [Alphaproteobacteria bacterium]
MLSGIRIFTSDTYWRHILSELGATLVDSNVFADVNIDSLNLSGPISCMDLKSGIISEMDNTNVLHKIFGRSVSLSPIQTQIVVRLYNNGGMTADELKIALGYAPDTATHTVDTAIYGLRKLFGRDFIKNVNGKFIIGGI